MKYSDFRQIDVLPDKVAVLVSPYDCSIDEIRKDWPAQEITVLRDRDAVVAESARLLNENGGRKFRDTLTHIARTFISHAEFKYGLPSGETVALAYHPHVSARRYGVARAYIVDEDDLNDATVAGFIGLFPRMPEQQRPRIIFRPKGTAVSLLAKLEAIADRVQLFRPGPYGLEAFVRDGVARPAHYDLASLYINFGFNRIADLTIDGDNNNDVEKGISDGILHLLKINSIIRARGRGKAKTAVLALFDHLEKWWPQSYGSHRRTLQELRCIASLMHGYVFENSAEKTRSALALAHDLNDPFLVAFGERMINLAEKLDPTVLHWLAASEQSFWKLGEPVQALYARHNRILSTLSIDGQRLDLRDQSETADRLQELAPYATRLSTVWSGQALVHLLSSNLAEARNCFIHAQESPGVHIHHIDAYIGQLVCDYLSGDNCNDEVEKAARRIVRSLNPDENSYHQSRMFFNLLRMATNAPTRDLIWDMAIEHGSASSSMDKNEMKLFASFTGRMPVSAPGGRYRGERGAFFERTGFTPSCNFIWD